MTQQNSEHSHMKGLTLQRYANYIDLYLDEVKSCDKRTSIACSYQQQQSCKNRRMQMTTNGHKKSILRAYNQSFTSATMYIKLFQYPTKTKTSHRSMFRVPCHNISFHLTEMLRLVSGKSMMAESAERHFNKLRSVQC